MKDLDPPKFPVPSEIRDIATAIAQGKIANAKMEWRNDGTVVFSADSLDGTSRILMEKIEFAGISEESKTNISKPENIEQRLQRVEVLHNRGMTQQQISKFTMTSQKTVSNDLKKLKERGILDN